MRNGPVAGLFFGPLMAAIAFSAPPAPLGKGDIPRTRLEFARAISKVQEGMSEAEVTHLLGPPDDVWTESDRDEMPSSSGKIWRYGTSGHFTNATLGQVYLDATGRVQTIVGQGEPVLGDLPEEHELRRMLHVLGEVPSYTSGTRFNPLTVIRAVNLLQPLGKQKKTNRYVFSDGTSLPELEPKHYHRTIWRPAVPGLHVSVAVKRTSSRFVAIEIMENHNGEAPSPKAVLRAFTADDTHRVLARLRLGDRSGRSATIGATETAFLNEGDELTLEVQVGSDTVQGPSFRP